MDYSSTIRAQIELEVAKVKSSHAGGVRIGYITNSHKGMPLFREGDRVAGLPVTIDRFNLNGLTVQSFAGDIKLRR